MLKAEFFNPPPEAIQIHRLVQEKYGAQLDQLVRFGDFFDPSVYTPYQWAAKLGMSANQRLHPSLIQIRTGQAVALENANGNSLSALDQQKLARVYQHDYGEIILWGGFGIGDVADPTKNGLNAAMESAMVQIVLFSSVFEAVDIPTCQFLEPLENFASRSLEEQLPQAQSSANSLQTVAQTKSYIPLIKEALFSTQTYQEIVVDKKPPLGQLFRAIEIADYVETAINAAQNNAHNGHILAAEVLQGSLLNLINYADYSSISTFLMKKARQIFKIGEDILAKSQTPGFNQIIIDGRPGKRETHFNQEKFLSTLKNFGSWLNSNGKIN